MQDIFPFSLDGFLLKLNYECNLRCSYCRIFRQDSSKGAPMSYEVIRKFYDRLLNNPKKYYNIQFNETEPLLSFDLIQKIFTDLPLIRQFCHEMPTNGVLLTPDKLWFLQEHSVYIKVTIDGGPTSYLKEKGDHLETVLTNLSHAPAKRRISLTYVITQDKLPRLKEDLTFLWEVVKDYDELGLLLNVLDEWCPDNYKKMVEIVSKFLQYNYHPTRTLFSANPDLILAPDRTFMQILPDGKLKIVPAAGTSKFPIDGEFALLSKGGFGTIFNPDSKKILGFLDHYGLNYSKTNFVGNNCDNCINSDMCFHSSRTASFQLSDSDCLVYTFYRKVLNDLQTPAIDYDKLMAETPLLGICLGVTNDCNMKCPYCFATASKKHMDLGTAKASLAWVLEQNKARNKGLKTHVNFFGGEPMLRFEEIIKPLVEWAEEMNFFSLSFGMTTNGTQFTPENIAWCAEHNVAILLSIDGGPETQNINRPLVSGEDSFELLFDIIPTLLKYYPDVTFRSTVYPATAHLLYENYLWAKEMGFNHYYCTPDEFSEWPPDKIQAWADGFQKLCWNMYNSISKEEHVLHVQEIFDNLKDAIVPPNEFEFSLDHLKRCGLGTSSIGIAVNGTLMGCQEHTTIEENIFHIGNIFTGIDQKKHLNLLRTYAQGCDETTAGHCPSHSLGVMGSLTEPSFVRKMNKSLMDKVTAQIFNYAQEKEDEVFLNYAQESFKKRGMM